MARKAPKAACGQRSRVRRPGHEGLVRGPQNRFEVYPEGETVTERIRGTVQPHLPHGGTRLLRVRFDGTGQDYDLGMDVDVQQRKTARLVGLQRTDTVRIEIWISQKGDTHIPTRH